MPKFRRWRIAGGTYFFTVVTHGRALLFESPIARRTLGEMIRDCQERWPFTIDAIVLLPEHLHAIWTLPPGDDSYSQRWAWIKKEFTKAWLESGGREQAVSSSRRARGDRGVWQPRFWEHTIDSEHDFDRHFDYIHYNPVRHGHVDRVSDWRDSSFHRWQRAGVYRFEWGRMALDFGDLDETAMEMGVE